jgi:hypothetical protein
MAQGLLLGQPSAELIVPFSRLRKELAQTIRLRVEVEDDSIIVTLPGTTFRAIYRKPNRSPGLVVCGVLGDKSAGIREVDFLACAWRVANDKARELGWIV